MQTTFSNNKESLSSWLLIIFATTILFTAAYTKYFYIPSAQDHNLERIRILFNPNDLKQIKQIELKNRLGSFKTERFRTQKMGEHWLLTSPRRLYAKKETIQKILNILEDIRIKKVYPNDEINLANFSLNSPNIMLSLLDETGGLLKISIGLINPIDNSTYLLSSDSDAIFHIQALPSFIEKLNFSDFIDSSISSIDFENITSIKIYKKETRNPQLDLIADKEMNWESREGRLLDSQSVKDFYQNLMTTQTHMILDVTKQEQKEAISNLLESPIYRLEVVNKEREKVIYNVSPLIRDIPDVPIEKRKYLLIQSSNKDYPHVYHKDILKYFYKSQYSFKRRKR